MARAFIVGLAILTIIAAAGNVGSVRTDEDVSVFQPELPIELSQTSPEGTRGMLDPAWGDETTNTAVCTASGGQGNSKLVPDGQGGAIIAWMDARSGSGDIYAQRVAGNGLAKWPANGVGVCVATGIQNYPQLIPDGQGGAIVVWWDARSSFYTDIYAQRLSGDGMALWNANGVPICTREGYQQSPKLVPDGQGGAIITWQDDRSGAFDIYAQRANSNGAVQWTADGVAICAVADDQAEMQIIPDGQGGAIIVWRDYRSGNYDIYTQRVGNNGSAQWATDGIAVCTAAGDQYTPQLIRDGQGGAIIVWHDYSDYEHFYLYAQRVNGSGTMQWTMNGVAVCASAGTQSSAQVVPDGQGGAIIAWQDYRSGIYYHIYAQRMDASGEVRWTSKGAAICTGTGHKGGLQLVPDGQGGAIIAWTDSRSGSSTDIYAQRVNMNGISTWTRNGLAVCTAINHQQSPELTIDSRWLSGNQQAQSPEQSNSANEFKGAIIVWYDDRNSATTSADIYAQAINEDGKEFVERHALDPRWGNETTNTAVCTAVATQFTPQAVSDGQGGAIIAWGDMRNDILTDIYVQRIDESGTDQWTINGMAVCIAWNNQNDLQLVPDGQGGVIIVWVDSRGGGYDIYVQRVNGNGAMLWAVNGVAVCTATGVQSAPHIVPDGQGGAIIVWEDWRNGNNDLYAQRVSNNSVMQWLANGIAISTAANEQWLAQIIPDGQGGAIIAWVDHRNGITSDIFAQRVSQIGTMQWTSNGVVVCAANNNQGVSQLVSDGQGGAIIAWEDSRHGNKDIYSQRVDRAGMMLWGLNGVSVCSLAEVQEALQIIPDGQGGAIISWSDTRNGGITDIYAQRISGAGIMNWTVNGMCIIMASGDQQYLQLVSDGNGGAIIAWEDYRSGNSDIYGQRVSNTGTLYWGNNCEAVCIANNDQYCPQLVSDEQGGAIITWYDYRSGSGDIYAQRISLTQSTVVINEVMHVPVSGNEWVELYNPSQVSYDISGWTLVDNTNTAFYAVPATTTLVPGAYFICDIAAPSLDNDDWAALYDSDGIMSDYVCWGIAEPFGATHDEAVLAQLWTDGTGFFVNTFDFVPGDSIGRDRDSNDSNSFLDWELTCGSDASQPTPGAQNVELVSIDIPLHLGWNLVSIPVAQGNTSIESALSTISGKFDRLLAYDPTDAANPWKQYATFWQPGMDEISDIDHMGGFWLNVTEACILHVVGSEAVSTGIQLRAGWNLVGYPTLNNSTTVAVAFVGTGADIIEGYDSGQTYLTSALAPSYVMKPGEAYWVHVPADTIWTVNW